MDLLGRNAWPRQRKLRGNVMVTALISAGSAVIVGILTLIGVVITNNAHNAVMEEKISNLTIEVRKHNNFAEKIPLLQNDVEHLQSEFDYWKSKLP